MKKRQLSTISRPSLTLLNVDDQSMKSPIIPPLSSPVKSPLDRFYHTVQELDHKMKTIAKIKTELLAVDSEGHRKHFNECTCTFKVRERGRENEVGCEVHKWILRNSKPHPYMHNSSNSPIKTLTSSHSQPTLSTVPLSPIRTMAGTAKSPVGAPIKNPKSRQDQQLLKQSEESQIIETPLPMSQLNDSETSHHPLGDIVIDQPFVLEQQMALDMLEKYDKLIRLNSDPSHDMAVIYARRSTLLAALEKYELSLKDAEKVLELEPKATIGFFRKGYALSGLKRYAEATNAFQQGLSFDVHSRQLRHALEATLLHMRHRTRTE